MLVMIAKKVGKASLFVCLIALVQKRDYSIRFPLEVNSLYLFNMADGGLTSILLL